LHILQVVCDVDDFGDIKPTELDEIVLAVVVITGLLLSGVTINEVGYDELDGSKPDSVEI
jgi:hypothetical protein